MAQGDVIRRKLGLSRENAARQAESRITGAEKALPLALARASRNAFSLAMDVDRLHQGLVSVAEVMERTPERSLICLMEGPEYGLGVMIVSPEVLAGLIEVQTLGKVLQTNPLARRPTRTDAAMVSSWLDQTMECLEVALAADDDLTWVDGFRYASFLDEARPLGLLLEDVPHRMLLVDVNLARGTKTGQLLLALPAEGRGRRPIGSEEADAHRTPPAPPFEVQLHDQIMAAECQLNAVLGRIKLSLGEVMALTPHLILPIGGAGIQDVALETVEGRVMARGKMGQTRGNRALRITELNAELERDQATEVSVEPEGDQLPSLRMVG